MHPAIAKLAKDGITGNIFHTNSTKKLSFYSNLFRVFTTNHYFCLFTFSLNFFESSARFQASSLPFRPSSVLLTHVKPSASSSFSEYPGPIRLDVSSGTRISKKVLNTDLILPGPENHHCKFH